MRVLRIQAKRSCRVLVMLGLAAAKKEGRERERERERATLADGHISGFRFYLRFF